ncbi:haloacid dehalogenase type II [Acidocella aromatica]|uniref:(S)-2-haloacid dehalogenase n=1 Tax=Acidocella aromatica TaxID=1303579 RepID=A0A840VHP3_9PROT|nr:haloacid dehalogenase type II [Acidocella aromatica]MBB5374427.1 2-haloacid dehalogenase [Acidocella aromatica]
MPPLVQPVQACVFDAYGTLFDFSSAAARFPDIPDDARAALTTLWRDKQLQYTWLRALQGAYADFRQVTAEALEFALDSLGLMSPARHAALMALYEVLCAFPEVPDVLKTLRKAGFKTAILSNGTPEMLANAIESAGLSGLFDEVLSVHPLRTYKTDRRVYQYALDRLGVPASAISFQSSNGWDAFAAADFGMRVVWCNRYGQRRERLPGKPAYEITTLADLPACLGLAANPTPATQPRRGSPFAVACAVESPHAHGLQQQ